MMKDKKIFLKTILKVTCLPIFYDKKFNIVNIMFLEDHLRRQLNNYQQSDNHRPEWAYLFGWFTVCCLVKRLKIGSQHTSQYFSRARQWNGR